MRSQFILSLKMSNNEYLALEVAEHEASLKALRERQEAHRKAAIEKHKASMQLMSKRDEEEISAAMQAFETNVAARRLYHEAPNDVFELFVMLLSDVNEEGVGKGGLNVWRLVSRRCLQAVESFASRLTLTNDVRKLPCDAIKRCRKIEHIRVLVRHVNEPIESLEGVPADLKSLIIEGYFSKTSLGPLSICKNLEVLQFDTDYISNLSDISSLASCTKLKRLILPSTKITDISPISSTLQLEELDLGRRDYRLFSSSSLSPVVCSILLSCCKLKKLNIGWNQAIKDLSPLSQFPLLEELLISGLTLVKDLSFFEKGFTKLRFLDIARLPVNDLSPLTKLQNLEELCCDGVPPTTSLLPLARCYKLKKVRCSIEAEDVDDLRERRPDINITLASDSDNEEEDEDDE